jgi:hypothetical protein
MITATATGPEGTQIIVLGVTRGNLDRLVKGEPIRVTGETHAGFPADLMILIYFGETERTLVDQIKPLIGDATRVVAVPREPGRPA